MIYKSYEIKDILIDKDIRDKLIMKYPQIFSSEFLKRVFCYLYVSNNNFEDNLLKITKTILAGCDQKDTVNVHYSSTEKLIEIQKVLNFKWVGTPNADKIPFRVKNRGIKVAVITNKSNNLVSFFTGKQVYKRKDNGANMSHLNEDQLRIVKYLNKIPYEFYSNQWSTNFDEIKEACYKLYPIENEEEADLDNYVDRNYAQSMLFTQQPIKYKVSEDTYCKRIFGVSHFDGLCVLNVKRSIRKAYFSNHWTADLRSSQFVIAAEVLNCEKCKEFIKTGKSIWSEFGQFIFGREMDQNEKDVLKQCLYSILYGKNVGAIKQTIRNENQLKDYDLLNKFFEHYLIKEILVQRKKFFLQIELDKGCYDAYGDFIPNNDNPRSVAALVMQSYELKIITELFIYAKKHNIQKEIQITSFLHDGITFNCTKNSELHVNAMQKLIANVSKKLGIIIELDITPPVKS